MEKPHYVILSVDAVPDSYDDCAYLQPPNIGEWRQTEGDEQYEFDYLGEEYENGRHRKWVAELTEDELDEWLVKECYASREDAREQSEQTMGMITEHGFLPAYSLRDQPGAWAMGGRDPVIDRNAYVGEYALAGEDDIPDDAREALTELYGFEERSEI